MLRHTLLLPAACSECEVAAAPLLSGFMQPWQLLGPPASLPAHLSPTHPRAARCNLQDPGKFRQIYQYAYLFSR